MAAVDNFVFLTPGFAVIGELAEHDFEALADAGFRSVISNRPDGEDLNQLGSHREAAAAWRAGLKFRHVPAAKADLLTDPVIEAMADAIAGLDGPILAHCKSGLRSAILWAAVSARSTPVDCVMAALDAAGLDLDFLRDDLDAQADRKRWLGRVAAVDCGAVAGSSQSAEPAEIGAAA